MGNSGVMEIRQDQGTPWVDPDAVLRGTPRNPLTIGDHVLAGPHSYLTGCTVSDEVFIATSAMVFNGAQLGQASSVALGGAVHIGCVVPAADPDPDWLGGGRRPGPAIPAGCGRGDPGRAGRSRRVPAAGLRDRPRG